MVTNRPSGRAFLSPRTFVVLVPFFAIRLLESKAFFHLGVVSEFGQQSTLTAGVSG